ncbi:hypothetical protein Ciccas_006446 [Cichlidogyrus casuarinus]|uniref:Uncharacterized protein n=1 Tax=Cichlidogyrus casuarinus TaxID=1844966 RepID=A0ABD2Q5Q8_9PLAT
MLPDKENVYMTAADAYYKGVLKLMYNTGENLVPLEEAIKHKLVTLAPRDSAHRMDSTKLGHASVIWMTSDYRRRRYNVLGCRGDKRSALMPLEQAINTGLVDEKRAQLVRANGERMSIKTAVKLDLMALELINESAIEQTRRHLELSERSDLEL